MKIKIDFLRTVRKDIETKEKMLAMLLDNYEASADEQEIKDLVSQLRYYADMVESIPIA